MAIVRFVGQREHEDERCFGVEVRAPRNSPIALTKEDGCDGSYHGKRYFKPKKPNRGLFVKSVVRKISPEELLQQVAWLNDENRRLYDNAIQPIGQLQRHTAEISPCSSTDEHFKTFPTTPHFQPSKVNHSAMPERNTPNATIVSADEIVDRVQHEEEDEKAVLLIDEPAAVRGTVLDNAQPKDETFPENSSVNSFACPSNTSKHTMVHHQKTESMQVRDVVRSFMSKSRDSLIKAHDVVKSRDAQSSKRSQHIGRVRTDVDPVAEYKLLTKSA